MNSLSQNLYITYSNQKARDLKRQKILSPLDKVITLDALILEYFENNNFEIIVDETIASSIIHKIIKTQHISYFSYLSEDAVSLSTIYNFIIKCYRNNISFEKLVNDEKLQAILAIDKAYQAYKKENNLVDISDIEQVVFESWDDGFLNAYSTVYIDDFKILDISFIKSLYQDKILTKLSKYESIKFSIPSRINSKIIKPKKEVFDNIDEVKTAIKIARKLLEDGSSSNDILIVASDIQEYAPLYKLFLDEYEMKGYSSVGTPLSSFHNTNEPKVQHALAQYNFQVQSMESLYAKVGLSLGKSAKENMKTSIKILDEKIGIELTEPNQLIGLNKTYKHIIFIGSDINHFPPKAKDNFLYSYEDDINLFYANDYFTSSQTQLNELKRLSENLYIITATYSGKRELKPSILLDNKFDETIDISNIKSITQLALNNQTTVPDEDTKKYYESIKSENFTVYDGKGVQGLNATHLSASQINKYLACPLAYLYSNKVKVQLPTQDDEGFDVMEQGSLMHLCYELFGKHIKENKITHTNKDELYNLMYQSSVEAYNHKDTREPKYSEPMKENIHHQIFLSTLQAGLLDDRALGLLAKFVDYYIENASEFEYFKNTEFEKEFALDDELKPYKLKDKKDRNYFIKGYIDRFDNLEKHINIVDYKSKKVKNVDKQKQEEVEELKDVQLALYILYAKQEYQNKTFDSHLLSFKGNEKGVKFASLEDIDEEKLKSIIYATKANIETGEFSFDNSDEKMCGWCDMKFLCHESVLSKNKI